MDDTQCCIYGHLNKRWVTITTDAPINYTMSMHWVNLLCILAVYMRIEAKRCLVKVKCDFVYFMRCIFKVCPNKSICLRVYIYCEFLCAIWFAGIQDGKYIRTSVSVEHPSCPVMEGVTRGTVSLTLSTPHTSREGMFQFLTPLTLTGCLLLAELLALLCFCMLNGWIWQNSILLYWSTKFSRWWPMCTQKAVVGWKWPLRLSRDHHNIHANL